MSEIAIKFLYELLTILVAVVGAGIILLVGVLLTALVVKIIEKTERSENGT